jgi:RNA polymerase sigma factor (sigma-70 family)
MGRDRRAVRATGVVDLPPVPAERRRHRRRRASRLAPARGPSGHDPRPAALPGWLATTTRRECGRIVRAAHRAQPPGYVLDAEKIPDEQAGTADDELLVAEQHAALREALSHLPPSCQQLISLLTEDPPPPYAEISARLGLPVGSIGPSRSRCLDKLRRHPAIAALIDAEASAPPG